MLSVITIIKNAYNLLYLWATGFLVGEPIGAVGGTTVGLTMAYQFERKIWKKIREAINKESKRQPTTADEIEHYSK